MDLELLAAQNAAALADQGARAFLIGIAVSVVSAGAIWLAAPRKVRAVAGQIAAMPKTA